MTNEIKSNTLEDNGVRVNRIGRHAQDQTFHLGMIVETPDGESGEFFLPFEEINDTRALKKALSNAGLLLPPAAADKKALLEAIQTARPDERCTLNARTGWYDESYVQPHTTHGPEDADDVVYVGDEQPSSEPTAGTLEEWKEDVADVLQASTLGVFLLCAALAPILMKFVRLENGMFHISGKSGVGKTTLLRVAGSVWPGGSRSVASWDMTQMALQEMMARNSDALVVIDEFSAISADKRTQAKTMSDVAYMVGSGIPRRRSKHFTGSAEDDETFRVLALSTGEKSAAEIAEAAGEKRLMGQVARVLDLPIEECPTGMFDRLEEAGYHNTRDQAAELADHLNKITMRQYGTASETFIRYVVDNPEHVEQEVARLVGLFNDKVKVPSTGWERRISSKFALAYAAGRLASEAGVLPYSEKLVRECCVSSYRRARSQLTTAEDLKRAALAELQAMVKGAVVVGSAKRSAPSVKVVDRAAALRVMKDGKTVAILVEVSAFSATADKPIRDALVDLLDEADIFIRPANYPREKSVQKIVIKGARRRRYLRFTKKLMKFEMPR